MTVPLSAAVIALDQRKQAVVPSRSNVEVGFDSQEARLMVLGFDLDLQELAKLGAHVGRYTAAHVDEVDEAAEAAWMDGVLTGLMLAELRNQKS